MFDQRLAILYNTQKNGVSMKQHWTRLSNEVIKGKSLHICVCGNKKMVNVSNIRNGKSSSCGCFGILIPSEIRRTFNLMKYRCNTKTSPDYPRWGGLGVELKYADCAEFYKDVGDKPSSNHSIDRIRGGSSNYEVGNCRWSTRREQSNNTSSNHNLTFNGRTQSIAMWAREYNIKYTTLKERIVRGWTIGDSLTVAVKSKKKRKNEIK